MKKDDAELGLLLIWGASTPLFLYEQQKQGKPINPFWGEIIVTNPVLALLSDAAIILTAYYIYKTQKGDW